jgi:uncharacterized protein
MRATTLTLVSEARWTRLDTPGSDSARLYKDTDGSLTLIGYSRTQTLHAGYRILTRPDLSTVHALIHSNTGHFEIRREDFEWTLNGVVQHEVHGLLDLDLGFTPSTNYIQVARQNIPVGERREFVTAWFDLDRSALEPLRQIYTHVSPMRYEYESPQSRYFSTLQIHPNGFVKSYPGLWEMDETPKATSPDQPVRV